MRVNKNLGQYAPATSKAKAPEKPLRGIIKLSAKEWILLDGLLERALVTHNNLDIKIARSVVRRIALDEDIKRAMLRAAGRG